MIRYQIINTGSDGNATVFNDSVLVDCGVPFRDLARYIRSLGLVLLTHIHSDHFNPSTVRRIASERPGVRWGCGRWLVLPLVEVGVPKQMIDVYEMGRTYDYGIVRIEPVKLIHNVENCGYKLRFRDGFRAIYATDTVTMAGIKAENYDLYLVEANYADEEIEKRIREKQKNGQYAYEVEARKHHLSQTRCDDWLYQNMGQNSRFVYMHRHREPDEGKGQDGEKADCPEPGSERSDCGEND